MRFDIRLGNGLIVPMVSTFQDAGEKLQESINEDQNGSVFGNVWNLATAFVLAGIDWPGWISWHAALRKKYIGRLIGQPQYRDAIWSSEAERKKIMWDRFNTSMSLARTGYLPEGVYHPQFLEGTPAKPSLLRKAAASSDLSNEALTEWFLCSYASQQVSRGANPSFGSSSWQLLRRSGLILSGQDVPIQAILRDMSMSELRRTQEVLGMRAERSLAMSAARILELALDKERAVRNAIARATSCRKFSMIQPPAGVPWDDFQSWRQQIKGMARTITDLFSGVLRPFSMDGTHLTSLS